MKNWHHPELIKRFGEHCKKLRLELKLSQQDIADKAEIEQSHVSDIENGQRNLTLDIIFSLAKAMGIEPQRLFGFFVSKPNNIRHIEQDETQVPQTEMQFQSIEDRYLEIEMFYQ